MSNTINTVKEAIQEQIKIKQDNLKILDAIEPVLKSFDGKTISKRIETAIKKALPEYTVYYGKSYSWYEVRIWGNGIKYDNSITLNLGYLRDTDTLNFDWFVKNNKFLYLEKERMDILVAVSDDSLHELNTKYEEYLSIKEQFKNFISEFPYPVSQYFKL